MDCIHDDENTNLTEVNEAKNIQAKVTTDSRTSGRIVVTDKHWRLRDVRSRINLQLENLLNKHKNRV